jgi:hypothetical protein
MIFLRRGSEAKTELHLLFLFSIYLFRIASFTLQVRPEIKVGKEQRYDQPVTQVRNRERFRETTIWL